MNNKKVLGIEFYSADRTIQVSNMRPSDLLVIAYSNYGKEVSDSNKNMANFIKGFSSKIEIFRSSTNKYQYSCIPH